MRTHVYYLCYRRKAGRKIRWSKPTGGLVQKADGYVQGCPVGDFQLAAQVLERRYHCGPREELVVCEVFEKQERLLARKLFGEWNDDVVEFVDLMEISRS